MAVFERPPGHKHVAGWEMRLGEVAYMGVCWWQGVIQLGSPTNTILFIEVLRQRTLRQICFTLLTSYLLSLPRSSWWDLPGHQTLICDPGVLNRHLEWFSEHPHCFCVFFPHTYPIK